MGRTKAVYCTMSIAFGGVAYLLFHKTLLAVNYYHRVINSYKGLMFNPDIRTEGDKYKLTIYSVALNGKLNEFVNQRPILLSIQYRFANSVECAPFDNVRSLMMRPACDQSSN